MASPAAVLSVVVKAVGVKSAAGEIMAFEGTLKRASGATDTFADKSARGFGIVKKAAGIGAVAIGAAGAAAVNAAGDYEKSLNVFQAVSGATGREMKNVGKLAKDLGADIRLPGTSAADAATSMTELAKGGLSVKDSMAAARGVLQLSAAAEIDNKSAATIAAKALNAFALKGKDATKVVDLLAGAANASTAEITEVADALQQSSAAAHSLGVPIEDLTTSIGVMANAGIAGSDAGTSLKTMFARLTPATNKAQDAFVKYGLATEKGDKFQNKFFDSQGRFVGMQKAIDTTKKALGGLSVQQRQEALNAIFGSDAKRAANIVLVEGAKRFDKMKEAVTKQGNAQALANAKTKGFKGSLEAFKSTLETLAITFGMVLLPAATKTMRFLSEQFSKLGEHKKLVLILAAAIGALSVAVLLVTAATTAWAAATAVAAAATAVLTSPITLVVVALAALGAGVIYAYKHSAAFRDVIASIIPVLKQAGIAVMAFGQDVVRWVVGAFKAVVKWVRGAVDTVVREVHQWDTLASFVGRVFAIIAGEAKLFMGVLKLLFRAGMLVIGPIFVAAWTLIKGVFSGAFTAVAGIVKGGLQVLRGIVQIIGGLFKGDFRQMWEGIKTIFHGGITALKGVLQGAWRILKAPVAAIGAGIKDVFANSWSRIKDVFKSGINAAIDFLNLMIKALNALPFIKDIRKIDHVGGGGGSKQASAQDVKDAGFARGGAFARTGGLVSSPITLMGEEAPRHPEYVIPTNPAYRGRAKGLLAQAAGHIGLAKGGRWGVGELEGLWQSAGGAGLMKHVMAIISTAESGVAGKYGDQFARNKSGATGLWQILGQEVPGDLTDAMVNAKNAVWKFAHQGLGAWASSKGAWGPLVGDSPSGQGGGGLGGAVDFVKGVLGKFPSPSMIPEWLRGLGPWAIDQAKNWMQDLDVGGGIGNGGEKFARMIAKASAIDRLDIPYGPQGHSGWDLNKFGEDCSSSVSKVLHAAGYLTSVGTTVTLPGQLDKGPGKMVTVHDRALAGNAGHTIIQLGNKFWGTSISNPGGGPGWIANPSSGYLASMPTKLHPKGMARGGVLAPFVGAFKDGGIVPRTGMALVHAGEAVLPYKKGKGKREHRKERHKYAAAQKKASRAARRAARRSRSGTPGRPGGSPLPYDNNIQGFIKIMEAQLALAKLSADPADDLRALNALGALYSKGVSMARKRGDTEGIASYASGLQGVRDEIKSYSPDPDGSGEDPNQPLIDALAAEAAAVAEHTAALKGVGAELKAQTTLAKQISGTSNYQLAKFLNDVISGQLGRGIVNRSYGPGTGVEVAY